MALLSESLRRWWSAPHPSERLSLEPPRQAESASFFNRLRRNAANIRVDEAAALSLPVYAAGVRLITGAVKKLPLRVVDADSNPVRSTPPWATAVPCPGMDAAQFKTLYTRSQIIRGFTVFRILSWVDGRPWRIEPLPTQVLRLHATHEGRRREAFYSDMVEGKSYRLLEWMGPGDDQPRDDRCLIAMAEPDGTLEGRSTLRDLTPTIALGLAMMEHASLIFTFPSAQYLLSLKQPAGEDSVEKFAEDLIEQMQREEKRHHALVTDVEAEVQRIGLPPSESQMIPARNQVVEEAARVFGIAPRLLALPAITWGTGVTAVRRSLHELTVPSWTESMASALNRTLPRGQFAIFDNSEALKGDVETEAAALAKLVARPVMTRNEGRRRMNLPPAEGGDSFPEADPAQPAKVEVVE